MNCEIAQKLILLFDEQEYELETGLFSHIEQCPSCQKAWKTTQDIRKSYQQYRQKREPAPLSSEFALQIQQSIRPYASFYRQHPHLSWFRQQSFLQAAAAVLLLAGFLQILPYLTVFTSLTHSPKAITNNIFENQNIYWIKTSTPKLVPVSHSSPQIPYRLNQNKIVEEIHRKNNNYYFQSVSTENWKQGIPYVGTPIAPYSTSSPTDF